VRRSYLWVGAAALALIAGVVFLAGYKSNIDKARDSPLLELPPGAVLLVRTEDKPGFFHDEGVVRIYIASPKPPEELLSYYRATFERSYSFVFRGTTFQGQSGPVSGFEAAGRGSDGGTGRVSVYPAPAAEDSFRPLYGPVEGMRSYASIKVHFAE
jgi:hypothetical protein